MHVAATRRSRTRLRDTAALGLMLLLIAAVCASASPAGTASSSDVAQSKRRAVIGVVTSLTGAGAFFGTADVRVAVLALRDLNRTSKRYRFELKVLDDQSTPQGAVSALQRLLQEKDLVAIEGGVLTGNVAAMIPLLNQSKLPSVMTVQGIPGREQNVFATVAPSQNYVSLLVTKVLAPKRLTKVAMIYQQQAILTANADAFEASAKKNGLDIVYKVGGPLTQTNWDTQVSLALASNPDAIFVDCFANISGTVVNQLRARGFRGVIVGQTGSSSPSFAATAGSAAQGVIIPVQWSTAAPNPTAKRLIDRYAKAYPTMPPLAFDTVANWDAIYVLGQAIQRAGSTNPAAVVKQLETLKWNGALGDKLQFRKTTGLVGAKAYLMTYNAQGNPIRYTGN